MIDVAEFFDQHSREFLKFERISHKRSQRPDLHAFLLLQEIQPSERNIVAAAEHDIIYLDVDAPKLAASVTEDQLIELRRCGVMWDRETGSLAMFT